MQIENNDAPANKWPILFVVIIGTFMAMLDSSIINIAIAKMMAVFGSSLETIQWVLSAYTLTLGAIVPLTAYLMDIWGNKKVFMFALGVFTLGSFLCGLAWSDSAMIAFRVLQAVGGGMIVPVGMTMIMQIFPLEERGMALGIWGIAAWAAPAVGPTLGGYIIQNLDWRIIFYLNVPIGVFGVIMSQILLKSVPRKPFTRFDYVGFITAAAGIVSILYVLGEGSSIDWSNIKNPLLLTLGGFSLLMFVINELYHPDPLLDLRILKNPDFSISQIIQCILVFSLMGGMYLVPLFLQNFRGYTAMQTGIIMLPSAIATGLSMPVSGKLFDKFGAKPVIIPGMLVLLASSYALAFINMDTSQAQIIVLLTIRGLAMGFVVMPVATAGMNAIPTILAGKASTINNIIKQLAGSLGVTILTTLLQARLNLNYSRLSEQITAFNPVATGWIGKYQGLLMQNGYIKNDAHALGLYNACVLVQKQAYVDAIDYAMMVTAWGVLLAMALVFFIRKNQPAG
ncbi:MAG: DHA2 family efflux MFS transporter permease subunit [Syntrophomonas sp.]